MPKKPLPAFPIVFGDGTYMPGMTLRDYFAIHVSNDDLQWPASGDHNSFDEARYLGISVSEYNYVLHWPMVVAKARYALADAMLEARKQQEGQ